VIYEVNTEGHECLILPIWGNGLWSTLYGYLAVTKDASRTLGITYYQHAETPGLGGEVDSASFKGQFQAGKQLYDPSGKPIITVVKAGTGVDDKKHFQVDGLSGATITGNGVNAMLKLWLSEYGYGKYLLNLRQSGT
jgi:Na+-transporting NADH:ubiquinone oxidoreductase subunit C